MSDIQFMQRALTLAKLGQGSVSPNPMVGCVIVRDGKIIGEGFHQKYGEAHAEVNAINDVRDPLQLPESTAYVTLEPCAHHGKTPPCADLLIQKKVKKVVVACRDPFEKVDGKGIERLRNAGIEVELGLMKQEAMDLNSRFLTFHQKKRPYIVLKWAQTQDGFIARDNGDSKWISNQYSRQLVHKWRTEEDAILVGKNTAITDNPSLTARDWQGKNPKRILLDGKLEVPSSHNILDGNVPTIVLNLAKNELQGYTQWIKLSSMDSNEVLEKLYEENVQSVIIEGGSAVLNSFIQSDCWDEARVFSSSLTFGKGISAPLLEKNLFTEEEIQGDKLTIFKNANG